MGNFITQICDTVMMRQASVTRGNLGDNEHGVTFDIPLFPIAESSTSSTQKEAIIHCPRKPNL